MALYLVENEEAVINKWGCYWIVKADNAKEAIDYVYRYENLYDSDSPVTLSAIRKAAKETGIMKRKLSAVKIDEKLFCGDQVYRIW